MQLKLQLDPILNHIADIVKTHELSTGVYARWIWQDAQQSRKLGVNAYGCADAANILYTLQRFPENPNDRAEWVTHLQNLQDAQTGLFYEGTHHPIHTTANCTAALNLFDARPKHPFYALQKYQTPEGLCALLEGLDWRTKKSCGHIGAGIYAAFVLAHAVDCSWTQTYFDWLYQNCDKKTGMWRIGFFDPSVSMCAQMGDAFHFYFNFAYARQPFPYPDALLDSCLDMMREHSMPKDFGRQFHFIEADWVYCLNRASRQSPHRFYEVKEALQAFAQRFVDFLSSVDWTVHDGANDLHMLFGTLCCLAELQQALPGVLQSAAPLRLVLDRRPFI